MVNKKIRSRAAYKVRTALNKGDLVRSQKCELCKTKSNTHAHHWNGYNNPLDIWWLCRSCNMILKDEFYHCGMVTKAEATKIVLPYKKKSTKKVQAPVRISKELNKRLEQLATKNVRSKNEQVVFILKEALKNYDAFLECVQEENNNVQNL